MSASTALINCSYVNSQFLRTLSLNSSYLQSLKGTRRGIETILQMFGYTVAQDDEDTAGTFSIHEYVYGISSALSYTDASFYRGQLGYAYDDDTTNLMDGYPVVPIKPAGQEYENTWYLVPWFDKNQKDKDFYFQSAGGWGKKPYKFINLPSLTDKKVICGTTINLYEETVPFMKFAGTIDDMLSFDHYTLRYNTVCYVDDIGTIYYYNVLCV